MCCTVSNIVKIMRYILECEQVVNAITHRLAVPKILTSVSSTSQLAHLPELLYH